MGVSLSVYGSNFRTQPPDVGQFTGPAWGLPVWSGLGMNGWEEELGWGIMRVAL